MIELVGLNKSFAATHALLDINLFIQEGEIFGIIGKSGAGKSTLLRTMNLLEPPDTGQVIIDNQLINHLKPRDLCQVRHKIGMIFQQFNLLNAKTVYDNIALPMRFQSIEETIIAAKIEELLKLVELTDKRDAYPEQLSGGQKQRVAIARALSCSPKILLCDEATSALDPETTSSILALLKRINQLYGITIALITHEMEVVKKICHRLAVIEAGSIVELTSLAGAINKPESQARNMIFSQLTPHLPPSISNHLITDITNKPVLKIYFQDDTATTPFISKISRELQIDINILLANIDRIDTITCGVLIIELFADRALQAEFLNSCRQANLIVEILGYVTDSVI